MSKIIIIGSGFASLSSACYLAQAGNEVIVLEKNADLGGRARSMDIPIPGYYDTNDNLIVFGKGAKGSKGNHHDKTPKFTFDMGPSWYWMPGVVDRFFADFDKSVSDYYVLKKLEPSFRMFMADGVQVDLPTDFKDILAFFDAQEPDGKGASKLLQLMKDGEFTYSKSVNDYMLRPSLSYKEFMSPEFIFGVIKGGLLSSYQKKIHKLFESPILRTILDFPTLFLGATPAKTPYLYNMMAYTMLVHGTSYPMGGMNQIVKAMVSLGEELGVKYYTQCQVKKLEVEKGVINSVFVHDISKGANQELFNQKENDPEGIFGKMSITDFYDLNCDYVVAGADYHFVEQTLLDPRYRLYSEDYWDKRVLAPSSIIFYIGVNKILPNLQHHNLFFDSDFDQHAKQIYDTPEYPIDPLFYLSVTSKTDRTVAPKNCENLFALIPIAPGLEDTEEIRDNYYRQIIKRISQRVGFDIKPHIICKQSYSVKNFEDDYNSYKGNAYGLANTLDQTAIFKPKMHSKKVANLVYAGQMTVPGPGIPPTIFSGKIAAELIAALKTQK
ncbi:MAG: phytoene desaturase [Candidatus Parcubacteria bacterium]|nr:phytoene desaturase [Candidatus Paceibacterota bacterium]